MGCEVLKMQQNCLRLKKQFKIKLTQVHSKLIMLSTRTTDLYNIPGLRFVVPINYSECPKNGVISGLFSLEGYQ